MSTVLDGAPGRPSRGTFCMIFGQHLCDSLLMAEQEHVFKVFITLTALSDADGVVEMSRVRLAHKLHMSREKLDDALTILSRPDPESRSKTHDGRRVIEIAGNRWQVVNRKEYSTSGKYTVQKEMKSAENKTTYTRRKSKGSSHAQASVSAPNRSNTDPTFEDVPDSSREPEAPVSPPTTLVGTPKPHSRLKFRKLSSVRSENTESGLIQPENNLTSSSTSISLSSSESNSLSTSVSPGRGESERGNHSAARTPSRQTQGRANSSEAIDPPWLTMFSDGREEAQLEKSVDLVIAAATRFTMSAEDEAQARTHARLLCKQGMFSDVVKTIRDASKGRDQSPTAFLEFHFVQELPAPRVFTIHPDEDDVDDDAVDEPTF